MGPRIDHPHFPRSRGFTLVELMVAMTLGLLLVAGIAALAAHTSQSNQHLKQITQQIENGRYATDTLHSELRHAGFYGGLHPPGALSMPAVPAALPNACGGTGVAQLNADMALFIQGEDSPSGDPDAACLSDADHVDGTDIVTVRRTSTTALLPAGAADRPNVRFLQATRGQFTLALGSSSDPDNDGFGITKFDSAGNVAPAPMRAWQVNTFYVAPRTRPVSLSACDNEDDAGEAVPTLMRVRLAAGAWCAEPIAAGVENLQVEYGIDTSNNGIPNSYEEHPDTPEEWADVMGLRIYLLARSLDRVGGSGAAKTYLMGEGVDGPDGTDTVTPGQTAFLRHRFATTVRLDNPSGRRELQ